MPFKECPICSKRYPESFIAVHAASCNPSLKRPRTNSSTCTKAYRTTPPKSGPVSETGAPGFHVFPSVFSDLETDLLCHIHATLPQWTDYRFRKVKNYGPPYSLRERSFLFGSSAPPQIPIPPYVHDLILPRMRRIPILSTFAPNQLTVAEYPVPGSHILPHNDCETGDIHTAVVGVCLAARCSMTLILRSRYTGLGRDVKKDVVLPSGAVYVMSGDSLRVWEHAIFPKNIEATRYSLTFRDVSPSKHRSLEAQNKRDAQTVRDGECSSRVEGRPYSAEEQESMVKASDQKAAKLGLKRRRLVQQRLT